MSVQLRMRPRRQRTAAMPQARLAIILRAPPSAASKITRSGKVTRKRFTELANYVKVITKPKLVYVTNEKGKVSYDEIT